MAKSEYYQMLEAWRSALDADLRGERGVLALIGTFWLRDGINTIGSSRDCTICLPKPMPRLLGALECRDIGVTFHLDIGQAAEINGIPVMAPTPLRFSDETDVGVIRSGEFAMAVGRHGGRLGLQVWNAVRARDFPARVWFDIDEGYIVRGMYTPYPAPVQIRMPDSAGGIQDGYVQGYVSFRLGGKSHNLDATETEDGRLFIQFRDRTNGAETYPEGRYLYSEKVAEDGKVQLDFNRATNPPSAFTTLAVCTFAAKRNAAACALAAGERYFVPPA